MKILIQRWVWLNPECHAVGLLHPQLWSSLTLFVTPGDREEMDEEMVTAWATDGRESIFLKFDTIPLSCEWNWHPEIFILIVWPIWLLLHINTSGGCPLTLRSHFNSSVQCWTLSSPLIYFVFITSFMHSHYTLLLQVFNVMYVGSTHHSTSNHKLFILCLLL